MQVLMHQSYPKTINDIVLLFEKKELNLSPGFQRDSVWQENDRKKLIESILRNNPIPSVFLYKRIDDDGHTIYDVIDGKQRIESIFMFMGLLRGRKFSVKMQVDDSETLEKDINWTWLTKHKRQASIKDYKLYFIEVEGKLEDIIDLFVCINSTGKALTSEEKKHAAYYHSPFLKEAATIANQYKDYFKRTAILSEAQISRKKHIGLICDLMISVESGDVIKKKEALEKTIARGVTRAQIEKQKRKVERVLNQIKEMFPNLGKETRFSKLSDFYTLAVLISKYIDQGLVLNDKSKNKCAWSLLTEFSTGVDKVREKQRKTENFDISDDIYRNYLLTVQSRTDELSQRQQRIKIIDDLIRSIFAEKDGQRRYNETQRRVIWNSSNDKKCKRCRMKLEFASFTVDHIVPHSRGGPTNIHNAALLCKSCNSTKGNR